MIFSLNCSKEIIKIKYTLRQRQQNRSLNVHKGNRCKYKKNRETVFIFLTHEASYCLKKCIPYTVTNDYRGKYLLC